MWFCWLALVSGLLLALADAVKPPVCQLVYGIRMGPTGTIEKVLDAARCQHADAAFIKDYLDQLKPQLSPGTLLELEINECNLTKLVGPDALARIGLRRLSIQNSRLEALAFDSLAGQENVLEELDLSGNRLEEVPTAIANLTALIRLNLSRNRIRSLPQGSVFFHLLKLRHLNLNNNRLGYLDGVRYPTGNAAGKTLPLAVFNLEPLREHIETITLRSNNMTAFPDQFARLFNRLRHLDLSSNNFERIPSGSFTQMPQLERLQLDSNKLEILEPLKLPVSLMSVSLRGNRIRCDCNALWLWQWSQVQNNRTGGAELELDDCVQPEEWRNRKLTNLPTNFCQQSKNSSMTEEDSPVEETDDTVRSVQLEVIPFTDEIFVVLQLPTNVSKAIDWIISYRKFGNGQSTSPPFAGTLYRNTTQILVGLSASTGYQVCVQLMGRDKNRTQYNRCVEVMTLPEKLSTYPVAEVAVAASVSTSTTLVVVILVCCCCPRMKRDKKKGKNNKCKQKLSLGGSSRSEDSKSKIFSMCVSSSESTAIWPTEEPFGTVPMSTMQRRKRPALSADEQSRQVFQATCNYLRQRAMDPSRGLGSWNEAQLRQVIHPRRPSVSTTSQPPIYMTTLPDGQVVAPRQTVQQQPPPPAHYFNAAYGMAEFNPSAGQTNQAYKYCTWRPPPTKGRPLLSNWTSYPDFLANSASFQHPLGPSNQPAIAVPVYSLTAPSRPKRKREQFYWSAAPAPIHNVELQF